MGEGGSVCAPAAGGRISTWISREEPPVSGSEGSGTVFFSKCTLRCIYCQNYPWSQEGKGESYGVEELTGILDFLRGQGCHNWNLVSPTPWLPMIREAVASARSEGLSLPVVYNTSGFERLEILDEYNDLTDIYLTDLRYSTPESARAGSGAAAYVDHARAALKAMWDKRGPLVLNDDGIALSGVICRLLVLPGLAGEAIESLQWLAENTGTDIAVSVMSQYVPAYKAAHTPCWNRTISRDEYGQVQDAVEDLGFLNGWVQEFEELTPKELLGFEMDEGGGSS